MNFGYILLIEKPQNMDSFYSTKIIKNKEKTKRQATKSPPFQLISISYHIPLFSPNFFLNPLSLLCTISLHMFLKYSTYKETVRACTLMENWLVSEQASVANSSLVMEDFLNLPMLWSGLTLYRSCMSMHACSDVMRATVLDCTKYTTLLQSPTASDSWKSSPSIYYLSSAEC